MAQAPLGKGKFLAAFIRRKGSHGTFSFPFVAVASSNAAWTNRNARGKLLSKDQVHLACWPGLMLEAHALGGKVSVRVVLQIVQRRASVGPVIRDL